MSAARSRAIDALVDAGITSSQDDMLWVLAEIKKREATATAHSATAEPTKAEPTKAVAVEKGKAKATEKVKVSAPTGKKAADMSKEMFKHIERLKYQDEDWKARDTALNRVEELIKKGALACEGFVAGFSSNLKDLVHSLVAQLYDLRSVIVRSAVKALEVLFAEVHHHPSAHARGLTGHCHAATLPCTRPPQVGDHGAAEGPMRGDVLEGLLQLASSGNKVLSAAGRDTLPKLMDLVRFESLLNVGKWDEGVLHWLRGMKQVPVKLACLNCTLQALQTWPIALLDPSSSSIEVSRLASHPPFPLPTCSYLLPQPLLPQPSSKPLELLGDAIET